MSYLIKENFVASNLLIVESKTDQYFFEALIAYINLNINIDPPICSIDEYKCLGGMGHLKRKLVSIKRTIAKKGVDQIGIIFDADQEGIEIRKNQIQESINTVFGLDTNIKFYIFINHVNGFGEIETLLREIKSENSSIADCLDSWKSCIPSDQAITQKKFGKLWVKIYQEYDCCTKEEQRQIDRKCNHKHSFKKQPPIYNFEHPALNDLKEFLRTFSTS